MVADPWMWNLGGPNEAGETNLATEILDKLVERPIFIDATKLPNA